MSGMHGHFYYCISYMNTMEKNGIRDASPETDTSETSGRITRSVTKKQRLTGDYLLSTALALLLYARKTQPFSENAEAQRKFRMPDRPHSLFEGLAGTVYAWADACAITRARLRKIELEEEAGHPFTSEDLAKDDVFKEHSLLFLGVHFCFLECQDSGGRGLTGGLWADDKPSYELIYGVFPRLLIGSITDNRVWTS